jgi:hypothetical protein
MQCAAGYLQRLSLYASCDVILSLLLGVVCS